MKNIVFIITISLLVVSFSHVSINAQAQNLDSQRQKALAATAFPGPMVTFENCLGDAVADDRTQAQAFEGCRTLAHHEVSLTQGEAQAARFDQEVRPPMLP
jgi:hypothetical protein